MSIECAHCGFRLRIPPDLGEDAAFRCRHCGETGRNTAAARAFRWTSRDAFFRRHGYSRLSLWGGLSGATAWIFILAGSLAESGSLAWDLLAAVALPYLLLVGLTALPRQQVPAARRIVRFLGGLGVYCAYLGVLLYALPDWAEVLVSAGHFPPRPPMLLAAGGALVLSALLASVKLRRRTEGLRVLEGLPPSC